MIGRRLVARLAERGDQPVILTRRADEVRRDPATRKFSFVQGNPASQGDWMHAVDGCDAVINLVGHGIFEQRWNASVKREIRDSRVYSAENIVAAIAQARSRPSVLVQSSAVGYYGPHGDEELTEESPSGSDFMAVVCREWEEAAHPAESLGVRVARIRTGIVLSRGEGALGVMTPLFKIGPGVPIGSGGHFFKLAEGKQWMSWIHIDDIVGLYLMALDRPVAHGAINGTAPQPARNAEFAKTLSSVLWRPYAPQRFFLPVGPPDAFLELLLGPVAQVITRGQRVLPAKAEALGYHFKFPTLAEALRDIFTAVQAPPEPQRRPAASGAHH
jgi:uncharacterized protein (TIGR01777 family)